MESTKQPTQKLEPLNNLIFGTLEKLGPTSTSGLYVPDSARKKSSITVVIAVGPDVQKVKPGMKILYKEYTEHQIKLNGEEFVLVEEADVLGEIVQKG